MSESETAQKVFDALKRAERAPAQEALPILNGLVGLVQGNGEQRLEVEEARACCIPPPSSANLPWPKEDSRMPDFSQLSDSELANRIAVLRDNLRQLTEQAAALSGAANEERMAERIETQSKELDDLLKEQQRRGH